MSRMHFIGHYWSISCVGNLSWIDSLRSLSQFEGAEGVLHMVVSAGIRSLVAGFRARRVSVHSRCFTWRVNVLQHVMRAVDLVELILPLT